MTLGELLKGKTLPVKLTRPGFSEDEWVEIFYVGKFNFFARHSVEPKTEYSSEIWLYEDWQLYTEPKKKGQLYQAVCKENNGDLFVAAYLFRNEAHARERYKVSFVKLVPFCEVEE